MNAIKLIVGLGNIGDEYTNTRHNAGFWAVDYLAQKFKLSWSLQKKYFAETAVFNFKSHEVRLLKPHTFMNRSGQAVLALASFYKIEPQQILVIHDELAFLPGDVRLKFAGGDGGHNGLKDITRVMGKDYWRLRFGIGHPGDKDKVSQFVLSRPPLIEFDAIQLAISKMLAAIELMVLGDIDSAMRIK